MPLVVADPQSSVAHRYRRAARVTVLSAGVCFAITVLLYIAISVFDYHELGNPGRVLVSTALWFLPSLTIFLAWLTLAEHHDSFRPLRSCFCSRYFRLSS